MAPGGKYQLLFTLKGDESLKSVFLTDLLLMMSPQSRSPLFESTCLLPSVDFWWIYLHVWHKTWGKHHVRRHNIRHGILRMQQIKCFCMLSLVCVSAHLNSTCWQIMQKKNPFQQKMWLFSQVICYFSQMSLMVWRSTCSLSEPSIFHNWWGRIREITAGHF